MEPFLGQMIMFGGNFAPRGWAYCEGQLLPISQNTALFSILGTTYGGDGRTTFALPDLRGRSPIQHGTGPGLPTFRLGQRGGNENTTLTVNNIPSHDHQIMVTNSLATTDAAKGNYLAKRTSGDDLIYDTVSPDKALGANAVSNTGGGMSFSNRSPYLVVSFIIALQGTFPSRN